MDPSPLGPFFPAGELTEGGLEVAWVALEACWPGCPGQVSLGFLDELVMSRVQWKKLVGDV